MAVHTHLAFAPYAPTTSNPTLGRRLGVFVFVTVLLQSAHAAYVLAGGSDRVATSFPDDAFYYLQVARNFAARGQWSFDGTAPATGFHLLWGYWWAAVFALMPRINLVGLYLLSFGLSEVFYVLSALALGIVAVECYGSGALVAVIALFLGTSLFMLPGLGMEAPVTLFFAAALCFLLFRPRAQKTGRWPDLLALYGVGLLGMLSRSDFGVLTFCCLLASILDSARRRELSARAVRPALVAFVGALSGLALVLMHCWWVSGHLLQASAQTKYFWSSLNGHAVSAPLLLLATSLVYKLPFAAASMYPVLGALVALVLISGRNVLKTRAPFAPFAAGLLAVMGYVVLYSRDSRALQLWYAASFGAPIALICAPASAVLVARFRILTTGAVALLIAATLVLSMRPVWPNQKALKDAGVFLAARPELTPAGAWNAGTLSYFAGRPITNLDGLVNDDILPYARSGTLAKYVLQRHLAYVVDYAAMLDGNLALRGGYSDGTLARCLRPQGQVDADRSDLRWEDSMLTIYKVDALCLEAHARSAR